MSETTKLPDGSGFFTGSMPLPENHWLYAEPKGYEPPPMPMRMGTDDPHREEVKQMLTQAGRYALRASTLKGQDSDWDPDAVIQNLVVGLLGYNTPDGRSPDEWANPAADNPEAPTNGDT